MPKLFTILAVNPGSTSTKIAVLKEGTVLGAETFRHEAAALAAFGPLWNQCEMRLGLCAAWSAARQEKFDAVATLGGLLKPVKGGVYRITETVLRDARANIQGEHASNLGCAIADRLARQHGCPAFMVDPVSVDEFEPLAYYSGHPAIRRRSLSHALNIHAAARWGAAQLNRPLSGVSCIVAHMGGGISVAPVSGGRIVDVNDAASDGPFSPERTGGLPLQQFISYIMENGLSEREMRRMVMGAGGLVAYLGTNSLAETETRIAGGDTAAAAVLEAMAYQIAKEIGAMATVVKGSVDAIILTGGGAYAKRLISLITERVRFLAPVFVHAGDDEMKALAEGVSRVLCGQETEEEYPG
ncbi:MAG TPA: butyrate kinase [Bacteroidota bacterium]|nr:butyrate kinase [Bacteroidota bacterium]